MLRDVAPEPELLKKTNKPSMTMLQSPKKCFEISVCVLCQGLGLWRVSGLSRERLLGVPICGRMIGFWNPRLQTRTADNFYSICWVCSSVQLLWERHIMRKDKNLWKRSYSWESARHHPRNYYPWNGFGCLEGVRPRADHAEIATKLYLSPAKFLVEGYPPHFGLPLCLHMNLCYTRWCCYLVICCCFIPAFKR